MNQFGIRTHGDDGNQTIGEGPKRLAGTAALAIKSSRILIVRKSGKGQEFTTKQEPTKTFQMKIIAGARQHLHYDDFGARQRLLSFEQLSHFAMHPASGATQIFDPGGGIDQDHRGLTRDRRISARSPSQPDPSRASACARDRGEPARRRSASSTASRLLARR